MKEDEEDEKEEEKEEEVEGIGRTGGAGGGGGVIGGGGGGRGRGGGMVKLGRLSRQSTPLCSPAFWTDVSLARWSSSSLVQSAAGSVNCAHWERRPAVLPGF